MDITKGSYVVSASLKGQRPAGAVQRVIAGNDPLAKLFSKEQRAFFEKYAPPKSAGTTSSHSARPMSSC